MFSLKNNIDKKGCNIMNIKLKVIKIQLELLRSILHFLLKFKKPTDKIVISCSQKLDEVIVKYYKINTNITLNLQIGATVNHTL